MSTQRYKPLGRSRKFHNEVIIWNGEKFDSKKEMNRWAELKLLERAGKIKDLRRQVKFELIPKQYGSDGKVKERECNYVADFVYRENYDGAPLIVEDTKGVRTPEYIIKRKLMLYIKSIEIQEV